MSRFGWVTLATNDSYSLGALVLAHSLRRVGTAHQLIVMVTPGVTQSMREKLRSVYDVVFEVNILDSQDERNLQLLQRPELGITFTKLHCWRLTQYLKCVFLDADTLVMQNCDELFDREEFSAAPDVGWPDCFNSGVFVYRPSDETFNSLLAFALERGSFDGGDQGLLNLYFSDWAHKDISRHLPFIYNMCSTACYSYLPAFKQFGENVKIIHFIGNSKPWLQYFNSETLQVSCSPGFEHLQLIFEHWWNLFCTHVHSSLQSNMARMDTPIASCTSSSHAFAYFLNESKCEDSLCTEHDVTDIPIWDPWENYQPVNSVDLIDSNPTDIPNLEVNSELNSNFYSVENNENKSESIVHESYNYNNTQSYNDNVISNVNIEYIECNSHGDSSHNSEEQSSHVSNSLAEPPPNICTPRIELELKSPPTYQTPIVLCDTKSASTVTVSTEQPAIASSVEPRTESNGGLAGAFAQMTLRQPKSDSQNAMEDHLRRQGWESGRIDYLGQDSFDNVWRKICETMATAPTKEPSPPKQVPAVEPVVPTPAVEPVVPAPVVEPVVPTPVAEPVVPAPVAEPVVPTPVAEPVLPTPVVPTPAVEPTSVPPTVVPAPVVEPVPTPAVEPAAVPTPVVEPVPSTVVEPVPAPAVEPAAVPTPVVEPVPAPVVEPVPAPAVEPATVPSPVVEPVPAPATVPESTENVAPAVEPATVSVSATSPASEPAPVSAPTAEPTAEQVATPISEVIPPPTVPEPTATVTPEPVSAPVESAPSSTAAPATEQTPQPAASTPVPPPRKSGKNGGAAKKSTKKK